MRNIKNYVNCPECHGQKYFDAGHNSGDSMPCITCCGDGVVSEIQAEKYKNRFKIWEETKRKAKAYLKQAKNQESIEKFKKKYGI